MDVPLDTYFGHEFRLLYRKVRYLRFDLFHFLLLSVELQIFC